MRKLLIIMMMFVSLTGFKQNKNRCISGTVYADYDHQPLPGATVRVKGNPRGTLTDRDGHYMINVSESDTQLIFESIGCKQQLVTIGKTDTIYLTPITIQLDWIDWSAGRRRIINKKDTIKK